MVTAMTITALSACAQEEGPILLPKPKPVAKPAGPTLLVMCDLACNWKLDGEAKGRIVAGGSAKAKVELGQHLVVAATEDGVDQVKQLSEVKTTGQTIVSLELKPVRDARLKTEQEARDKVEQQARDKAEQDRVAKEEIERSTLTNSATFNAAAKDWRKNSTKPPLSPEAEHQRILAENAIKENDLDSAARHFESLVQAQPMWPNAWFNLAVIYSGQKKYTKAVDCMKHYLTLVPDAPDAKDARTQMIVWEDKATRPQ